MAQIGLAFFAVFCAVGCNSWFDQSEVVRAQSERLVVPILDRVDPIDEADTEFPNAQDVTPKDLVVIRQDYVIGAGDLLSISVYDLAGPGGVETNKVSRVSDTGMISLPMLPEPIKAAGKTEFLLQRDIVDAYRKAEVLVNARVAVAIVEARHNTFSIMGAVARPGQFAIPEPDFRILNALVQSGDTTSPAEFMYVVRKISAERPTTQPSGSAVPTPPVRPELTPGGEEKPATMPNLAPEGSLGPSVEQPILAMADVPATAPARVAGEDEKLTTIEGQPRTVGGEPAVPPGPPAPATPPTPAAEAGRPAEPAAATQPSFEFGVGEASDETRVIRIPLQQLKNGDLRYNIVVRPGDVLIIPTPIVGFYYMGGHVGAPGAYNMTGQKITLKQAITAARMLDPLAVPARTDVIRRVGNNEVFVRVNLYEIFKAREPDIYLKPNDVVLVGTDFYPPFLQAIRGAFRMTYGFGFLYDRNYAPAQTQSFSTSSSGR